MMVLMKVAFFILKEYRYITINNSTEFIYNKYKRISIDNFSEWIIISPENKKGFVLNHDKIMFKNKYCNLYIGIVKLNNIKKLFVVDLESDDNVDINIINAFRDINNLYKNMVNIKLNNNLYLLTNFELCLVDNIEDAQMFLISKHPKNRN